MKKRCPFCNKRKLRKIKAKYGFEKAHAHILRCSSCQNSYLPSKQERKIDRRLKD